MNIKFMKKALEIAGKSGNDVPIGAIIVKNDEILAAFHNEKEKRNDTTAHAEILAIREASKKLNNWRLTDCDIYVTLEPCPMCTWAILQSRIKNVYFGSYDNVYGGFSTQPELIKKTNWDANVKGGIMEDECNKILNEYFERLR